MSDSFEDEVLNSLGGTMPDVKPVYKKLDTQASGDIFKFEKEGDLVEGIYTGSSDVTTKMGVSKLHQIGDKQIWGNTMLNKNLGTAVPVGAQIRITFLGKAKGKSGFFYNNFNIEVAE
jgi:hypothetical protein